jgi:tetratricopeptide (TPR) repeat protein
MVEDVGLLADLLVLLGAFSLGVVAGLLFMPLRRLVLGFWNAPGRLLKGTQNAGAKLRQAFSSATGETLDRSGVSGKLAGAVSDVLTLRVRRAEVAFREGIQAFDDGDYEEARRNFRGAIFWDRGQELKPMHVLAHLRLGWLDEERRAWSQAREHYQEAVHLDPDHLPATVRLGMMHFRLGETGPAIFQFQRALELDPGNLDTHYYLYAIYRQAGMEREALEQLRIVKAGESSGQLVDLFARHGEEHFRLSRFAEALSDYELALQFAPRDVRLYSALGDLYYLQQQPHAALDTWCRGLWVGYSDALAERVLAVAGTEVDAWSAIQLVRDCMAQHSRDGRYSFLLSRLLRRIGEEEESVALLERAARMSPHLLEAQQELGDFYAHVGQDAKAQTAYRAGLRAALHEDQVFRCRACGYVTEEEQLRCFQCGRWGTFEGVPRQQVSAPGELSQGLLERADAVRQSLRAAWSRISGQLPPGHQDSKQEDAA